MIRKALHVSMVRKRSGRVVSRALPVAKSIWIAYRASFGVGFRRPKERGLIFDFP